MCIHGLCMCVGVWLGGDGCVCVRVCTISSSRACSLSHCTVHSCACRKMYGKMCARVCQTAKKHKIGMVMKRKIHVVCSGRFRFSPFGRFTEICARDWRPCATIHI